MKCTCEIFSKRAVPVLFTFSFVLSLLLCSFPAEARRLGRFGGRGFSLFRNKSFTKSRGSFPRGYGRSYTRGYGRGFYPGGGFFFFPGFPMFGGGGFGKIFLFAILAFVAFRLYSAWKERSSYEGEDDHRKIDLAIVKIQIGLLGNAIELQNQLNRLAINYPTTNRNNWSRILHEISVLILRNKEYIKYASIDHKNVKKVDQAEAIYDSWLIQERGRAEEGISNVDGKVTGAQLDEKKDGELMAVGQYIVFTILTAISGMKPDKTKSLNLDTLFNRLYHLGSVSVTNIAAVEVLWTPQTKEGVLTEEDIYMQFPNLKIV